MKTYRCGTWCGILAVGLLVNPLDASADVVVELSGLVTTPQTITNAWVNLTSVTNTESGTITLIFDGLQWYERYVSFFGNNSISGDVTAPGFIDNYGNLTQFGGTIYTPRPFRLYSGTYTMEGGVFSNTATLGISADGNGAFVQNGGTVSANEGPGQTDGIDVGGGGQHA